MLGSRTNPIYSAVAGSVSTLRAWDMCGCSQIAGDPEIQPHVDDLLCVPLLRSTPPSAPKSVARSTEITQRLLIDLQLLLGSMAVPAEALRRFRFSS